MVGRQTKRGDREKRPHTGADCFRVIKIDPMAGDDQAIRFQRFTGADQGPQIPVAGRPVEDYHQQIVFDLKVGQIPFDHINNGDQFGSLRFLLA